MITLYIVSDAVGASHRWLFIVMSADSQVSDRPPLFLARIYQEQHLTLMADLPNGARKGGDSDRTVMEVAQHLAEKPWAASF